ncbi:MalY/PatB family protein [Spongisporangium articulatum]|uniref:cysteine-S-conjugate beta-lyase n=1 Tax=Spongisporangium articulatum TaxID=3362603 RepID=A0ABW8ATE0_9ACTN
MSRPDFDLTDDELRAAGSIKWARPAPGVLPAWVAEMDVAPCPAVQAAVRSAVDAGRFGYPVTDAESPLPDATAAFLGERFGWDVDPVSVVTTGDVMAGVTLVLERLCEPAPVVVPLPAYPPFLAAVPLAGRTVAPVPMLVQDGRWELDLAGIDAALADGARTVLLANPHNPTGRAFTPAELEGLRDVVHRHGARVISDEIHAPLVLPGARHTPYASLPGAAAHTVTATAASKAFNFPGLKCAQLVVGSGHDLATLRSLHHVSNHGVSSLGITATVAAYSVGGPWLDGLLSEIADRRTLFTERLADRLPRLRYSPGEATYLAWVDARGTGLDSPAAAALERAAVMLNPGRDFGAGYEGFVRVNLATSRERLERVVERMALAFSE